MPDDLSTRAELARIIDELFITADRKEWKALEALFVDGPIDVDMTSLTGGTPARITAADLVAGFKVGLHAGKATHHMTTNYRFTIGSDRAEAWVHGYAWNRVPAMPPGRDVWETWGNYHLGFVKVSGSWRLSAFRYFSTRTTGNDAVRTHTLP